MKRLISNLKLKIRSLKTRLMFNITTVTMAISMFANAKVSAAGDFGSSNLATGTLNIIQDILNWSYLIVPLVGTAFFVYFAIRRSGADQQEKKQWSDRMMTALISTVLGVIADAVLQMILGYYQ